MTAIGPFGPEEPVGISVSARNYPRLTGVLVLEDKDFAAVTDAEEAILCVPLSQPQGLEKDVLVEVAGRTQKLAMYEGRRYRVLAHVLDVIPGRGPVQPKVSLRFALFDSVNPPASSTEMVA